MSWLSCRLVKRFLNNTKEAKKFPRNCFKCKKQKIHLIQVHYFNILSLIYKRFWIFSFPTNEKTEITTKFKFSFRLFPFFLVFGRCKEGKIRNNFYYIEWKRQKRIFSVKTLLNMLSLLSERNIWENIASIICFLWLNFCLFGT